MKRVYLKGAGAVSPAGWNAGVLREAVLRGEPLPTQPVTRPGSDRAFQARRVPAQKPVPPFLNHARLRRASPISIYTVSAALEALGSDLDRVKTGALRLGVVSCVLAGCIQFTRRFYEEALRDPRTASPLIFPETVFNAPSSHLAAILGSTAINYTIVGDPGAFLQGLALAAQWISEGRVDGCLIIGAEEFDWLTADALNRFSRTTVGSEGSGAIYLSAEISTMELTAVTDAYLFTNKKSRTTAIQQMRQSLSTVATDGVMCDSGNGAEPEWKGPRLTPAKILGDGLMAGAAWQCVLADEQLRQTTENTALISYAGNHQQAIGACFARVK